MEKRKILNKVLAIFCLIVIAMPSFSTVVATTMETLGAASSETAKFGISFLNENGWGYKIQNRLTYRTYEIKGSARDYSRNLYCLDFTKKFPNENSNKNTFTKTGDLTSSIKNKDRIRLIAENMYLTNMSSDEKDAILSKIFADLIAKTSTNANPVTLEYIKKTISEDDIFFAQQCAIWKYTNNIEWQGAAIWLSNVENPTDNQWYQISNVGEARFAFMQEIYNYLTGNKLVLESSLTNPSLIKNTKTSKETDDGYIVGPFHIKTGTNTNYSVSLEDQSGATLSNYVLVDKDGNRLSTTLENTLDKDFYVRVPLKTQTTKIVLKLSYNTYKTTTSVWENGETGSQPILEVTREKIPGSDNDEALIEKPEKIYDLALRKYIVQVEDTKISDRTPYVSYNKSNQEITYKHKKDPVVLNAGDKVIYNITVYNEGNQKGAATRVKDYLPEGLEFIKNSEINKKYGWISSQDGSYIVTSYTKDYELDPYDSVNNKISSITVQVECKVKENVTSGVLTNVAEIVEDNIDDIDSTPGTINLPQSELPDYKGKDSNKKDLTDSNYFYRGQEDDDDFEKVTVEQPKLDLALRKYISTVNGENKYREPVVDVTGLKNGTTTTATYTHSKVPVEVQKGDIVVYSIRVYNEGSEDAYANEITDYIPEGLGFLVNYTLNNTNKWQVVANESNQVVKLTSIENATKNVSISEFQNVSSLDDVDVVKGKAAIKTNKLQYKTGSTDNLIQAFNNTKSEPSSKVVQVACVVLSDNVTSEVIKNIAAVTDERDANGDKREDRDSEPLEIDVDGYPADTNIQDDDDFEKIILVNKVYDLSLRKYITELNNTPITDREPQVNVTALASGAATTAIYNHTKNPIEINIGDRVVYTLRVYNEGNQDAIVGEIKEHLPAQLKFLENDSINKKYGWTKEGDSYITPYLANTVIKAFDGTTLDNQYVQIACEVVETENMPSKITNIAEISEITDVNGNKVKDRDSEPENVKLPSESNLPDYKGNSSNKDDLSDSNYFYKGQEDDDDFEKLIYVKKNYDLALKKFLSQVDGTDINPSRLQSVDTTPLKEGKTDAKYTMDKSVVKVKTGNNVVYTIRVYNEGELDAYAEEVKDNIPEGLEYVENSSINSQYRWKVIDGKVVTDYLSKEVNPDKVIKAFNKETGEISYQEVKIEFKVVSKEAKVITNIAEIKADDGEDFDSTPDNNKDGEDDQDYDNIIPAVYDLALQKFITKLDDKNITSRVPSVSADNNGKISYNHTNEPLTVVNGSVVVYTIRVYNEGTVSAYVEEVKDDVPDGLVFLPNNEVNKKYGWKIYDADGKETSDVAKAKYIRTDYLSQAKSQARGENNELKPFDKALGITDENPDYRDVQVAFKVDQSKMAATARTIKNIAEITADNGDDIDSTPDNDKDGEDDIDDEIIELKYFDLSLLKYVTKVVVNEDGKVKEIATGHDGTENPEPAVKVEINRKKLDKTSVTFIYTIKVTNEGEIEGYAKEIKDRIPEGLEFYTEDNPQWKISEEGIVTTDALANTLLKPGESATVEIALRWKRSDNNLGMKVNTAEISKDENPYGTPDIDSTPDNNKDGEDDQDTAPVILSITTGSAPTYIVLTITIMTILSTGFYSIKKFVL